MGLKDLLESRNIPLPSDFDDRLHLVMLGLRKDPQFDSELASFKSKTTGGGNGMPAGLPNLDSEDWMGPKIRMFLDVITSPEARGMLKALFMVIFFISYLESIPVFGNILSVALDIMIAGGKAITKSIQSSLPATMGLLPIPFSSIIGLMMAAVFGAIVWPLIAMVAFSRQDFAAGIESYIRVIPPPFGSIIADNFMELNRMLARIDVKRQKLAYDITTALLMVADVIEDVSSQVNAGIGKMNETIENGISEKIGAFSNTITNIANPPMPSLNVPSLNPYRSIAPPAPVPEPSAPPAPVPEPSAPPAPVPEPSAPPAPVPEPSASPAPVPELTPLEMQERAKNRAENPEVYGALNPDEDHSQRQQAILRQKELTPEPVAPSAPPAPVPAPSAPPQEKVSFPPIPPRKVGKGKRLSTNRQRKVNKWTRTLRTKSKRH
jgi:hypothetical protein